MKVLKPRDEFLSNYEVQHHLNAIRKKNGWVFSEDDKRNQNPRKRHRDFGGLGFETVVRDSLLYLQSSPCAVIGSDKRFKALMVFLADLPLMKAEKLQIVNTLPRSMVVLYALVEECDTRLSEEESEGVIAKINELFPVEEKKEEDEEEEEEEEEMKE